MKRYLLLLIVLFAFGTMFAAPLNEGFESTTCPASGWSIQYANTSYPSGNTMTHSNTYYHQGARSFRFSSFSSGAPYDQYLITPELVVTDGDQTVSFWYRRHSSGSETFRVGWSSTGTNIATDFTWSANITNASATWQQYSKTDLPVGTKYVALHYSSNYQYYLYIDTFAGPETSSVVQPASLVSPGNNATNVLETATLNWNPALNATGYKLNFGKVIDEVSVPILEDEDMLNVTTYDPPGDMAFSTKYYWQVIPYNSGGDAQNCPTWYFTTRENPVKPLTYTQNFDSGTILSNIGWTGDMSILTNHGTNGSNGLYKNLYSYITTTNAVSPQIGPLAANCQIMFDYRYMEYTNYPANPFVLGTNDKLEIQVSYNGGAYNTIRTIDQNTHITSTAFASVIVPIIGHAGELVNVKFLGSWGSGDYYLDIDNVVVRETPTTAIFNLSPDISEWDFGTRIINVPATKTFTVTNTGAADLVFTSVSVSGLYYSEADPFDITALPSSESRNFTVKFHPTAEATLLEGSLDFVFSRETKSVALTGACVNPTISSFPWTENFDSVTVPALPVGWQSIDNNGDGDKWETYATNPLSSPNAVMIYTDYNSANDDYLVTPPIVLTGNQRLRFWTRAQSAGEPDELSVLLSTTTPTPDAFTNVLMPSTPINFTTYTEYVLNLSAYSGTCFISFARKDAPADGWRLYIDNVTVENIPQTGVLAFSPDPVACGSTYVGVAKRTTVSMTNTGALPFDVESIALADETDFQLENLPVIPFTINPDDPAVTFTVVFNPTVAGDLSTQLLIGDTRTSFDVSGTGVQPQVGEICENPYLVDTLPLVDYEGSTLGFINDYTSAMFSGLTITANALSGLDWVAKISVPALGILNINLANTPEAPTNQYIGMVLVNSIPSLASPAPVLGQVYAAAAPMNISNISVVPGDYYLIVDNWPTPVAVYFKLNITFTPTTEPPAPVNMVSPIDGAIDQSLTPTFTWTSGGGTVEKYFVSYGKVNPFSTIVDDYDNALLTTYTPAALENNTEYWWKIRPWNSVGGSPDESEIESWTFTTLPAGLVIIGSGTATSSFPFYTLYEDARTQTLFTADELLAAGAVPGIMDRIGYNVATVGTPAMNSFMIRVTTVPAATASLSAFVTNGLTTVYGPTTYAVSSTGWNTIDFDTPFSWNGTDNIIIDVSFNNSNWGNNSTVYATAAAGKTWARNDDGQDGNTMAGGVAQANRPNTLMRFYEPIIGPPAPPILNYPGVNATGLPKRGFELRWASDLMTGGAPDYYEVYLYNEDEGINLGDIMWETTSTSLNPTTYADGPSDPITFEYNDRWYWVVNAINTYGSEISDERWFVIESDPSINSFPYLETFEAHADNSLPAGWNRSSNATGWEIGTDLSSTYWGPPAHTVYAAANDDAAGNSADGSMDLLFMPPIDLSGDFEGVPILSFDSYYTGEYGELAYLEVNTDGVWELLFEVPTNDSWVNHSISLADYIGESEIRIRFHADDDGNWADGWAIDNVAIDLLTDDIFPPIVDHYPIIGWPIPGEAIEIWCAADDNAILYSGLDYINLVYSVNGGASVTVPMLPDEGYFTAMIPAQAAGTNVSYYLEAGDTAPTPNVMETDIWDFEINSPVTLQYDSGTLTTSVGLSSESFGVMTGFDNPFGSGNPIKINYVTAGTSNSGNATVHVFSFDSVNSVLVDVIPPFTHYFPANVYQTIPLTDCITTAGVFYVAFTDVTGPNYFNYDGTQDYYPNTHFVFFGAGYDLANLGLLSSSGFPGSWMIRANVQYGMQAPDLEIGLDTGNPQLSWAPVAGANGYKILAADAPNAPEPWEQIGFVTGSDNVYTYNETVDMKFFKVIATPDSSSRTALANTNKLSVLPETFIKSITQKGVKLQSNKVKR